MFRSLGTKFGVIRPWGSLNYAIQVTKISNVYMKKWIACFSVMKIFVFSTNKNCFPDIFCFFENFTGPEKPSFYFINRLNFLSFVISRTFAYYQSGLQSS